MRAILNPLEKCVRRNSQNPVDVPSPQVQKRRIETLPHFRGNALANSPSVLPGRPDARQDRVWMRVVKDEEPQYRPLVGTDVRAITCLKIFLRSRDSQDGAPLHRRTDRWQLQAVVVVYVDHPGRRLGAFYVPPYPVTGIRLSTKHL